MRRKFNIGDKVKVKSIEWYTKNCNDFGTIQCVGNTFVKEMSKFCGKIVTISIHCNNNNYNISEDESHWGWTEDMFEDSLLLPNYDIFRFGKDFFVILNLEDKTVVPEIFETEQKALNYVENRRQNKN